MGWLVIAKLDAKLDILADGFGTNGAFGYDLVLILGRPVGAVTLTDHDVERLIPVCRI
jgi:hypothetical protein